MDMTLSEAKTNFCKVVQAILEGKEDIVVVSKNGKPAVQITIASKKNNKRIGIAKKEMAGFDISLEQFNSISVI